MSNLRSAIEELRGDDLRFAVDAQLEEDLLELERTADALLAERLRRLAEIDRRKTFQRDGLLSTVSWLAHRRRTSHARAKRYVRMARALEHMPETFRALADGEITSSAAEVLVESRQANPGEFERGEAG